MNTSLVAAQYRLREWAEMIRECNTRPKGQTVPEWCESHGLTKAAYYYRLKAVRKACLEAMPGAIVPVQIHEMSQETLQQQSATMEEEVLVLETDLVRVKVTARTSEAALRTVLQALKDVQ